MRLGQETFANGNHHGGFVMSAPTLNNKKRNLNCANGFTKAGEKIRRKNQVAVLMVVANARD